MELSRSGCNPKGQQRSKGQKVNNLLFKFLKRANVPASYIICFYFICIRPVLQYCAPLYNHALPDYLTKDIERIQKRALSILSPGRYYDDSLSMFNMAFLEDRRIDQCEKKISFILSNSDHKLHHFLSPENYCHYNLRRQRHFANPVMRTKRFCSAFLPSMCRR